MTASRPATRSTGLRGPFFLSSAPWWCPLPGERALVAALPEKHPEVRHLKVEDGPGKPLGRSFRVKLWPTLVFLRDGRESPGRPPRRGRGPQGLVAITEQPSQDQLNP